MPRPLDDMVDVAVVGAGPAGLLAACLLAQAGARVAAFGPSAANADDARTSALFMGAIRLLGRIGAWPALMREAAPLAVMRIVDRLDRADHPSVIVFEASEIGPEPFGYNIPNPPLGAMLEDCADAAAGVLRIADTVETIDHSEDCVTLATAGGTAVRARLVVAADGRGSKTREAAGIAARAWDYGQSALVTSVSHDRPHDSVSQEVHRPGGPFTTVPLPGCRSSVLWLGAPDAVDRLMRLGDADLAARMEAEIDGCLGAMTIDGPRAVYPVGGLSVEAIARARTALVGEAAHVVAPIGAQGLNLGFRDVAALAEVVGGALARGEDPGGRAVLDAYVGERWRDVAARQTATDLLNRSLLVDIAAIRGARGIGLALLAGFGPLRRQLMRRGMAEDGSLPRLMRP